MCAKGEEDQIFGLFERKCFTNGPLEACHMTYEQTMNA